MFAVASSAKNQTRRLKKCACLRNKVIIMCVMVTRYFSSTEIQKNMQSLRRESVG